MQSRTIKLAQQLLGSVPKAETEDLIRLLQYYNRFAEEDRVKAMRHGSKTPVDKFLEEQVIQECTGIRKIAAAKSYVTTNQDVCRCCGR